MTPGVVRHTLQLRTSLDSLDVEIDIELAADFTDMAQIRLSRFRDASGPVSADQSALRWKEGGKTLTVAATGAVTADGLDGRWRYLR